MAAVDALLEDVGVVKDEITRVAGGHPTLCRIGIERPWWPSETPNERRTRWEESRQALLEDGTKGFVLSLVWLADKARRKTPDPRLTSYQYKHDVERLFRKLGYNDT